MIPLIILLVVCIFLFFTYNSVISTPHGKVEFKTGLALRFLKEYDGDDVLEVRKAFKSMAKTDYAKELPVQIVENFNITTSLRDVPVRLYKDTTDDDVPLLIFIHGGGWCIGDLDTHDQQCRRLAITTGCAVLALDYLLSPESKFPAALNETVELIQKLDQTEISTKADIRSLAIIGDSAGGNMAITVALKLNEAGDYNALKCIVPVYPVISCEEDKKGSFNTYSTGYILTSHLMKLFSRNYIPENQDLKDPYLSPIFSTSLQNLPPCFILTAGFDPLRDEGEQFIKKLEMLGNPVEFKRYENCVHSFFGRKEFGQKGLDAIDDVAKFLRNYLK